MATAQVAEQRRKPPSELFGITCEYCAYCFDEALIVRKLALEAKSREEQMREQEQASAIDKHRDRLGLVG